RSRRESASGPSGSAGRSSHARHPPYVVPSNENSAWFWLIGSNCPSQSAHPLGGNPKLMILISDKNGSAIKALLCDRHTTRRPAANWNRDERDGRQCRRARAPGREDRVSHRRRRNEVRHRETGHSDRRSGAQRERTAIHEAAGLARGAGVRGGDLVADASTGAGLEQRSASRPGGAIDGFVDYHSDRRGALRIARASRGGRHRVSVNLGMNVGTRCAGTLRIRADVDRIEREARRILRIDVIPGDPDIKRRLSEAGAWAAQFRDLDTTTDRRLPDRVVLNREDGGLLSLHEKAHAVAGHRAGCGHAGVA